MLEPQALEVSRRGRFKILGPKPHHGRDRSHFGDPSLRHGGLPAARGPEHCNELVGIERLGQLVGLAKPSEVEPATKLVRDECKILFRDALERRPVAPVGGFMQEIKAVS